MKRPLLIFCAVLTAYLLTAGGHLYSPDEEIMFRTTRALATRGSLAIEKIDASGFGTSPADPQRPDGPQYAQYGVGQPLLAVPFYWIGAALTGRAPAGFWAAVSPNPFNPADGQIAQRWACSWFNVLLGALLAVLLYGVCLELTGHAVAATWAAFLYALGSLAWPHSRPFFTESCASFFILLSFYALLRAASLGARTPSSAPENAECGMRNAELNLGARTPSSALVLAWCALAGAAAGYAALVRADATLAYPALAVLLIGPIVSAARRAGRSFVPAWIAFCIPALICGGVLLGLNWLHYGGPFKSGYQDQPEGIAFGTPIAAGLYGFLFSAGKGLFFFSPALVLSFLGWRHLAKVGGSTSRRSSVAWAVALAVAVPLAIHAKWQNWPGGWCWGPRHIFMIHPFLALPIAAWMAAAAGPAARVAAAVFLVIGAAVQLLGASQDFMIFHHRFFRSPGDISAAWVIYDDFDRLYWDQYFQLEYRAAPGEPPRPIPLVPPRPIQDSIYIPQASVWAGYPKMLNEGYLDNFWVRLAHAARKRNTKNQ